MAKKAKKPSPKKRQPRTEFWKKGERKLWTVAIYMSLWAVDDRASLEWMEALYRARLIDRLDTADAVRAASLAVIRERRASGRSTHPFYWAAFVSAGDWR